MYRLLKAYLTLILCCLFLNNAMAQKVTTTPAGRIDAYTDFIHPIGNDEDGYVILNFSNKEIIVQGINIKDFSKRTEEYKLKIDKKEKSYNFINLVKLNNKFYIIYYHTQSKTSTKILAREINLKNATVNDRAIELIELDDVASYRERFYGFNITYSFGVNTEFDLIQDEDKTHFSLIYSTKLNNNSNKQVGGKAAANYKPNINVLTFNDKLELAYNNSSEFPYAYKDVEFYAYTLDNSGNLYFLLKNKELSTYELHKIGKNKNIKIDVNFKDNIPDFSHLKSNSKAFIKEGNLVSIIGYYYLNASKIVAGYYMLDIDNHEDNLPYKVKTYPFDKSAITKNLTGKILRKLENKKGNRFDNLDIKKIIYRGNNHYTVFSEIEFTIYNQSSQSATFNSTRHYSEDLLMTEIENEDITLFKKIAKSQISINEYANYMSFSQARTDKGQYIFYYDNENNLNLEDDKQPSTVSTAKSNALFCVFIDRNGKSTQKIVDMPKGYHCAGSMYRISKNKLLIGTFNGFSRKLDLTIVTIE